MSQIHPFVKFDVDAALMKLAAPKLECKGLSSSVDVTPLATFIGGEALPYLEQLQKAEALVNLNVRRYRVIIEAVPDDEEPAFDPPYSRIDPDTGVMTALVASGVCDFKSEV